MSAAFSLSIGFEQVTCCHDGCGITFALSADFVRKRRKDHAWWYCPNGHPQHWSQKSEEEKLRERLRWAEEREESAEASAREARRREQAALNERNAERAAKSRIKNRVGAGVCPVKSCRRSFENLQKHMKTEHPKYRGKK